MHVFYLIQCMIYSNPIITTISAGRCHVYKMVHLSIPLLEVHLRISYPGFEILTFTLFP